MCTIVALNGVRTDGSLVIATNRDEFYARKTSGPMQLLSSPQTVGGRDLEGPGTWMGVTREGLFVGVTNQRGAVRAPDKRSRGEVVIGALARGNVQGVLAYLRTLDGRAYNEFNLLWGDARALYVAYGRASERALEIEQVPRGLHVLPNDRIDSPAFVKVTRIQELVGDAVEAPLPVLIKRLEQALGDRQLPPFESIPETPDGARFDRTLLRELAAVCVRTPSYGTRSSTVVALGPSSVMHYGYADGPPDVTTFVDVLPLFGA
jgi:uncharacterized protein with NRDE domain